MLTEKEENSARERSPSGWQWNNFKHQIAGGKLLWKGDHILDGSSSIEVHAHTRRNTYYFYSGAESGRVQATKQQSIVKKVIC